MTPRHRPWMISAQMRRTIEQSADEGLLIGAVQDGRSVSSDRARRLLVVVENLGRNAA